MAKLTREDVLKLAQLARLNLKKDEVDKFAVELTEILDYVEQLDKVNTNGLEPTHQVSGLVNVSRKDKIKDYGYKPLDLLNNVPYVKDNHIQAKRMIY